MKNLGTLIISIMLFVSCIGDRKTAIGTDFSDTSFVNKSYKTNKIAFNDIKDACSYISESQLAKLYGVPLENIKIIKGNTQNKICTFYVKLSDEKFDHIIGSISFYEEKDKNEDGSTWVESWQIRKNVSKSSKWIPNFGKGAYYKGAKRELFVKFNDYTMSIVVPGSDFNQNEKAKNRDYEKIALAIAKNTPFKN